MDDSMMSRMKELEEENRRLAGSSDGKPAQLELNLRIKPKKRPVREKPEPLAEPTAINQVWSMDFMHDHAFGRSQIILPSASGSCDASDGLR
jgi:hypothetical protein